MFNETHNSYTDNTDNVETLTHLSTISGTARNSNKRRVLVQRRDLGAFGFSCGARYNIETEPDGLILRLAEDGVRRVARVFDKRRGFEYQTLDLRIPEAQHAALFNGAAELEVFAGNGVIIIKRAAK